MPSPCKDALDVQSLVDRLSSGKIKRDPKAEWKRRAAKALSEIWVPAPIYQPSLETLQKEEAQQENRRKRLNTTLSTSTKRW